MNRAVVVRRDIRARSTRELGQAGKPQVDLCRRRAVVYFGNGFSKRRGQLITIQKSFKCPMRIDTGRNGIPSDNRAVRKTHSLNTPVFDQHATDFRFTADLDAQVLTRAFQGIGQSPHTALNISPDATRAAGGSHDVVQQHVCSARRGRAARRHR